MSDDYHHGTQVTETTDLSKIIRDISTSIIGVICIADDADAATFPLNTPVLLTRPKNFLGKAGKTGILHSTLKAISDQASPKTIVIRVPDAAAYVPADGEGVKTQDQLVIGGVDSTGKYTGLFALLLMCSSSLLTPWLKTKPATDDTQTQPITSPLPKAPQRNAAGRSIFPAPSQTAERITARHF